VARKKLSPRAERRTFERAARKLGADRERLARLEAGGDPSRPITLESASQVEPHALGQTCLRCGSAYRLDEHAAISVPRNGGAAETLRVARLRCTQCGALRDVWFRLTTALPN
jgi:hypothetical protein